MSATNKIRMKQSKPATPEQGVTGAGESSTKRRSRDTSPRHSVLLDRSGNVVRRLPVARGITFLLNVRDGHYYDAANPTTFVQRVGVKPESPNFFLRAPCPVQRCEAWPGWACGNCHAEPIHRARIVAALKMFTPEKPTVQP